MRISPLLLVLCAALGASFVASQSLFGQGDLTPPGAPAATMKTLNQVEPRTPIQSLPSSAGGLFAVTQPGSYYLTANIAGAVGKNGIEISVSGVTIDLNGFRLDGLGQGTNAVIATAAVTDVVVFHGSISSWTGRAFVGSSTFQTQFRQLSISNCAGGGILVGSRSLLIDCQIDNCGSAGAPGSAAGISTGNNAHITNCTVSNTQNTSDGISVDYGSAILNTTVGENAGSGIVGTGAFVRVQGCTAFGNGVDGIRQTGSFTEVVDTNASSNGTGANQTTSAGIHLVGSNSRVDHCSAFGNSGRGIAVDTIGGNNVITRNTAHNNNLGDAGTDYFVASGNRPASIVFWTAANGYASGDPLANTR